jgi:lysophospholipase L1-like esterase
MKTSNLLRLAATLALVLLAVPAGAQQADFTTFVQIGDSLTHGVTDGCVVEYAQRDSFGALIARSAGAAFEEPLIKAPGLGGCLVLTSLAPTFANRPSTGVPTNSTLARPYNNLGVSGFTIANVVDTNPTTPAGGIAFTVLRGLGTALQQAASLKPTFVTIYIGNNDVLGAATSGTAVEGLTLTPMSVVNAKLDTIFSMMKAAQGGTGKGIVLTVGDVATIPFFTVVSPILGTYPAGLPNAGQPIFALSSVGCPAGVPVCPVPPGSLLTLLAAGYLQAGVGVPCAILAPTDPKQDNCNKPLPDNLSINPSTGAITPGVVLTPPETAAIRLRTQEINAALTAKATAAGYKVFDVGAFFTDVQAHGRTFAGMTVTTAFLSGGFFGYDGIHPTTLGYAILARDVIKFINANYGNNLPDVNMYDILFNGNTSPGGYPIGLSQSPEEQLRWAAEIYSPETWETLLKDVLPQPGRHRIVTGSPEGEPVNGARDLPGGNGERVH